MMSLNLFRSLTVTSTLALLAAAFTNPVYIISNAETPSLDLPGLTPVGRIRAEKCLPPLFAHLDIGLIVSCPLDVESGLCSETLQTASHIASSLNMTIDTSCGAGEESDDDCVPKLLKTFAETSTQAMLVVWDLNDMDSLFDNLDIDDDCDDDNDNDDDDDDDDDTPHFDFLTTVVNNEATTVSQGCENIDGQAPGTFRRSIRNKRSLKERKLSSRIVRGQA